MSHTADCGHGCHADCKNGGGCVGPANGHGKCCTYCNGDDEIECHDIDSFETLANSLREGEKINIKMHSATLSDISRLMKLLGVI